GDSGSLYLGVGPRSLLFWIRASSKHFWFRHSRCRPWIAACWSKRSGLRPNRALQQTAATILVLERSRLTARPPLLKLRSFGHVTTGGLGYEKLRSKRLHPLAPAESIDPRVERARERAPDRGR